MKTLTKKVGRGVFVALLVAALTATARADLSREEKRLLSFGKKALEDRLNGVAAVQFEKLLTQFPQSEARDEASWLLARARLNDGDWQAAQIAIESVLPSARPDWQDGLYLLLGEAQLRGGLGGAAGKTFDVLSRNFPKSRFLPEARYGLARALVLERKFDAAQEMLRALQKEGRGEIALKAALSLGVCLAQQKKYDEAAQVLARLAKEEAKSSVGFEAMLALGEVELERKLTESAKTRFESITKSDHPEARAVAPAARLRLGEIEAVAGNWPAAAAQYEQAFRTGTDSAFRLRCVDALTVAYLKLDKPRALADRLAEWADDAKGTPFGEALLLQVGALWKRADRRDQAIRAFQDFFEKYPNGAWNDRAHLQFGWVFLDDKKYDSAAAEFQKAADRTRDPQVRIEALLKLGDANLERQQFEVAAAAYAKAAQVQGADPSSVETALYQEAQAWLRAGKPAEVVRLQTAEAAAFPSGRLGAEFLLLSAEAARRQGQPAKAAEALRALLDRFPESSLAPRAWLDYAETLRTSGRAKEGAEAASAFLEKFPKHALAPRAAFVRAACLEQAESPEKAAAEFEAVVKAFPRSSSAAEAQFWLGAYYDRLRNYAKAQEQFELLRKSAPTHPLAPEATYFAARAAYRLGQRQEDIRRLIEALIKDYPDSPWAPEAWFLYGDILAERGKFQEALKVFEDLVKPVEAGKPQPLPERVLEAQGRRGQCLRQLKRHEEALVAFKAVLDSPKADTALRNQAFVETGKTCEAMGNLTKALENYLAPLYEKPLPSGAPEGREFFWICRGGLEAERLLESQKDWRGAARVLRRLSDAKLPCQTEAEERLRQLQAEHAGAN
ncbi:MAG: tetratricopeptide repeat protein [Verrucomicrobiae bacterium]|nr:tetratricopeptide repeat protein [Verrucomicrobiae bacterium]